MKNSNNLLQVITVTLLITSFAVSQSKINVNHLLDYGGLKFMPISDKPFNADGEHGKHPTEILPYHGRHADR